MLIGKMGRWRKPAAAGGGVDLTVGLSRWWEDGDGTDKHNSVAMSPDEPASSASAVGLFSNSWQSDSNDISGGMVITDFRNYTISVLMRTQVGAIQPVFRAGTDRLQLFNGYWKVLAENSWSASVYAPHAMDYLVTMVKESDGSITYYHNDRLIGNKSSGGGGIPTALSACMNSTFTDVGSYMVWDGARLTATQVAELYNSGDFLSYADL